MKRLEVERRKRKLTLRQLGDLAGGIAASSISRWENGKDVTLSTAVAVARALGVSVEGLDTDMGELAASLLEPLVSPVPLRVSPFGGCSCLNCIVIG